MPEYATFTCPYCSVALVPRPRANERCSACGRTIRVQPRPDGSTYLLRDDDLPAPHQAWAEQRHGLSKARPKVGGLLPRRSLALVVLATVVQATVVLAVAVPVGRAILSGSARPAATSLPRGSEAAIAGHSPASSRTIVTPAPTATGMVSGAISSSESTPRPIADTKHPAITGRAPGQDAANVSGASTIVIVFSEPVRNVSDATIQLINVKGGWRVHSTVHYDPAKRTAILTPDLRMYPNTEYGVAILAGLTDQAGNRLTPTSWSFRVGSR